MQFTVKITRPVTYTEFVSPSMILMFFLQFFLRVSKHFEWFIRLSFTKVYFLSYVYFLKRKHPCRVHIITWHMWTWDISRDLYIRYNSINSHEIRIEIIRFLFINRYSCYIMQKWICREQLSSRDVLHLLLLFLLLMPPGHCGGRRDPEGVGQIGLFHSTRQHRGTSIFPQSLWP